MEVNILSIIYKEMNEMIIGGNYSFNNGEYFIKNNFPESFDEVQNVINLIDAELCKTKVCKEKNYKHKGEKLYSPVEINKCFKNEFNRMEGWDKKRIKCGYVTNYYTSEYNAPEVVAKGAYREKPREPLVMEFYLKNLYNNLQ